MSLNAQTFRDFSGGLDNRGNPASIGDNKSPLCYNVDIDEHGKVSKRRGSLVLFSSAYAKTITSIAEYVDRDGVRTLLYTLGTDLYKSTISGGTASAITGTLTFTESKNTHFDFAAGFDSSNVPAVYGVNNVNQPFIWNGTGSAAVIASGGTAANLPDTAKCVLFDNGRVLFGNVKETNRFPNKVNWSSTSDPQDFTDTSKYIFVGSGTDPIVAMIRHMKMIIVFKERSIYRLDYDSTDATYVPTIIHNSIGCAAQFTVAATENEILFLSQDGVYALDPRGTDEESVRKISNPLDSESWATNWHTARKDKAHAVYYRNRNQYRIFIAEGATEETADENRTYYAYHTDIGSWTKGSTTANCSAVVQDGSRQRLYVGDYSGQINRIDYFDTTAKAYVDSDNGSAIDAYWYTADLNMGRPETTKGWHKISVVMNSTTNQQDLEITQYKNFGEFIDSGEVSMQGSGALLGSFILNVDLLGGGTTVRKSLLLAGYSTVVRFKFRNNAIGEHFTILSYTVEWEPAQTY